LGDEWSDRSEGSSAMMAWILVDSLVTIPNRHRAYSLGEREAG